MSDEEVPTAPRFSEQEFSQFLEGFIARARGRPLILLKFQGLGGGTYETLFPLVLSALHRHRKSLDLPAETAYFASHRGPDHYLGIQLPPAAVLDTSSMFRGAMADIHAELDLKQGLRFLFGIGRTQANHVSDVEEIFAELDRSAQASLDDNARKINWASFSKLNNYFGGQNVDAVVQPLVEYSSRRKTFSVIGGEVFVGGILYQGYQDLMRDLPSGQDLVRLDLLILEKLLTCSRGAPGLLKFNVTPQTLIDTFDSDEKVDRFLGLVETLGHKVENIRLELVEKAYSEDRQSLLTVCQRFSARGITFAADDFGMKSQGHQLVLELGEHIKEFKLDPISFQYRVEDDHTKFLDNLAFLQYCKHLANNREAMITAEALEDVENLDFLLGHQIYHFQANIFCGKMTFGQYQAAYQSMQNLPADRVFAILHDPEKLTRLRRDQNIFQLAQEP